MKELENKLRKREEFLTSMPDQEVQGDPNPVKPVPQPYMNRKDSWKNRGNNQPSKPKELTDSDPDPTKRWNRKDIECFHCRKRMHIARECRTQYSSHYKNHSPSFDVFPDQERVVEEQVRKDVLRTQILEKE